MKLFAKNRLQALRLSAAFVLFCLTMASCAKDNEEKSPVHEPDYTGIDAYITDTILVPESNMVVYRFNYSSKDPYGQPTMLSGIISMGDAVQAAGQAKGMLIYNHYTIFRWDECPSLGELTEQKFTSSLDLVTVSADYYGFGLTSQHHQAYCVSRANAQASVDAYLGARKILVEKGFLVGDLLFNAGYSQGGQTSLGVVRLIEEKYPDIHITHTFAGAGPYDIPETYRQFIKATIAGMPSTVVGVFLAYNEYFNMGVPYDQIFVEPVLSHIDDWFLSRNYTRREIDSLIGSLSVSAYSTPALMDSTNELSRRFFSVFESDNLCKNWDASHVENVLIFHNTKDITVPVETSVNMYNFLVGSGATNIVLDTANYGGGTEANPAHESAAPIFTLKALFKISEYLKD